MLDLPSKPEMDEDIALMTVFMKRRYPNGKNVPTALIEIQDFVDVLMRDLGLRSDRKRMRAEGEGRGIFGAWREEWFVPYLPRDYKGVVEEFLCSRRGAGKDKGV